MEAAGKLAPSQHRGMWLRCQLKVTWEAQFCPERDL